MIGAIVSLIISVVNLGMTSGGSRGSIMMANFPFVMRYLVKIKCTNLQKCG